ncbi:ATP-binding protein [Planctomycetota bacterium]
MRAAASETPQSGDVIAVPGAVSPDNGVRAAEVARKALRGRPVFSIRMQVYLGALFFFVLVLAVSVVTVAATFKVEGQVALLEMTSKIVFEIQQARRFEKNFFLHGTSLLDALESTRTATRVLLRNSEGIAEDVGKAQYDTLLSHTRHYEEVLQGLQAQEYGAVAENGAQKRAEAEPTVRMHGHEMVSLGTEILEQEKKALDRMMINSRWTQILALLLLFLFMVLATYTLGHRVVVRIRRFVNYAQRIAAGDETPIMPARGYRDEFSSLALAMNHMVAKLEQRQDVLVQSHKLRAIGTLTAGIAHELNNPINNITLTAHMLLEDLDTLPDEERREMVQDIIAQAARTGKIVHGLLDFARQSESVIEPLDLGKVVKETLSLGQNQLNVAGLHATLEVAPHLPPIHGDGQQLNQVFLNLILNAIAASHKGDKVYVSVEHGKGPNFLCVKVSDFGRGIPEHILPHIFEPFFTTNANRQGTGLGLSVSQGIIRKHGGNITVETKVGEGTTFTVNLPVTSLPAFFDEAGRRA